MDIGKTLEKAVESGAVPGVAAAAATDKGVIFEGGAGVLRPDSVIWIASMTKAVTAAAAMQLVERGKLSLDGPASDVVPELGTKQVLEGFDASGQAITRKPKRPITLRHLLTHTSGLGYDTWNADVMKYRQATGIPAVGSCQNAALTTPLLAEPGERWEYGISIDWAGKMVEAASGQRLDRYMTERLFVPLGMGDTGFAIGPAQRMRKAKMHTRGPGGFSAMDHEIPQMPEFHMGGGGLYSTVSDYLKFTQALLAGGGPILKPETVKLMAQNHMAEGVLCRPLKSQLPHMQHRLGLRRWHEVGPLLHDQPDGVSRPPLGRQPHLGRPRQLLLLDRSGEEGDRRVGDPASAVLRPQGDRGVREFRARGLRQPLVEVV